MKQMISRKSPITETDSGKNRKSEQINKNIKIRSVIKKHPIKKIPGSNGFTGNSTKHLRKMNVNPSQTSQNKAEGRLFKPF